jgi:hypothetical protein
MTSTPGLNFSENLAPARQNEVSAAGIFAFGERTVDGSEFVDTTGIHLSRGHIGLVRHIGLRAAQVRLAAKGLLLLVAMNLILYRFHDAWVFLSETLEVEVLDILLERHLPWFLVIVVQLAELSWIHSQFACHLDLSVRQTVSLARLNPCLHFLIWLFWQRASPFENLFVHS